MSTIKDKLQQNLVDAQNAVVQAQAVVTQIEQQIANIPAEVEGIDESAWDRVKDFFKAL